MQLNQVAVSVANTAGLTIGSAVSTVEQTDLPPHSGLIAWSITIIYGLLQIVKAMPWFTDLCHAFWLGVRYGDWTRWNQIGRREEKGQEDVQ